MFERFEEEAVRCILAARDEACRLGHKAVGTEHLLVGMLQHDSRVQSLFAKQNATMDVVRGAIERLEGIGEGTSPTDLPFTPDAQKTIAMSWSVAEEYRHGTIVPLHLFKAILGNEHAQAHAILSSVGLDVAKLSKGTREMLAPAKKSVRRGPYLEDELEVPTPYGPVTLALIRLPDRDRDQARIISLSAEGLNGPNEVSTFLSNLDRLLEASSSTLTVAFFRDLFRGLGDKLDAYLQTGVAGKKAES